MPRRPGRHVDDPIAVGRRLREARAHAGVSQRQLSFEGATPAYISRIEAGQRVPSLQVLAEFARRLGVTASYLATGSAEPDSDLDPLVEADLRARLGDVEFAEAAYRDVVEVERRPERRARALAGLGELAVRRGDHREAADLLEQALSLEALPADQAAAVADRLGRAYALLGDHAAALGLYEEWLARAREDEDALAVLRFATLLANVLIDRGNLGRAEELLGSAIAVARQSRDPLDRARLWWSQSRVHAARAQPELAGRYARMALETLEASDHLGFAAVAYQLLAHVENDRGRGDTALELLDAAEPVVAASGNRYHLAMFQLERARALVRTGDREEAASLAMATSALLGEVSPPESGRAYVLLGDVYAALDERARAIEVYELAANTLLENDYELVRVYSALAELLEAEGRPEQAMAALKRALAVKRAALAG